MPDEPATRRLRVFALGKEPSRNPLVPRLQALGRQVAEAGIADGPGVLSARYGKRVLITAGGASLAQLGDVDFVEIVDYDPQRNVCKLLGPSEPNPDAGIHWLIYNSREEIGGIVHLHDPVVLEVQEALQMFPETRDARPSGSLELAVEALKLLRKSPYFVLKGHGCVAVGKTPDEAFEVALRARQQALEVVEEAASLEAEGVPPPDEFEPTPPRRR